MSASIPPLNFLLAGCPSCRPTNSVKALKAHTDRQTDRQTLKVTDATDHLPHASATTGVENAIHCVGARRYATEININFMH